MSSTGNAPRTGPPPRHPVRQKWWWWAAMLAVVLVVVVVAARPTPTKGLSDQRAFALATQLKCLQCVGESVGASQAPLAVKFRQEIDRQMRQGRTDDEILNYFAQRYGRQVLETPPSTGLGALVWVVPVLVAAGAVLVLAATFRRWRGEREDLNPTDEDEALVAQALAGRRDGPGDGPATGTEAGTEAGQ